MDLLEDFPKKKKKDGEESQDSGPKKVKTAIPDDPFHKDDVEEGGPGSGPHSDDEDNPFDTEPSDDDLAAIEKEFEGVNEANLEKVKLPAQVNRFLNKFVQSMKDTKLNRMKRSAILYKVIEASGMSVQQLMADITKIKKELK